MNENSQVYCNSFFNWQMKWNWLFVCNLAPCVMLVFQCFDDNLWNNELLLYNSYSLYWGGLMWKHKVVYPKFCIGVFNQTLSIYHWYHLYLCKDLITPYPWMHQKWTNTVVPYFIQAIHFHIGTMFRTVLPVVELNLSNLFCFMYNLHIEICDWLLFLHYF